MRFQSPPPRRPRDASIALINVVFLLLVFFLFAGTVTRDDAGRVAVPEIEAAGNPLHSTGALVIARDGAMSRDGAAVTLDMVRAGAVASDDGPLRIVADRELPADRLKAVLAALAGAGARDMVLITRRAAP